MRNLIFAILYFACVSILNAQEAITLAVPPFEIWADQLLSGDADTYGLGDFDLSVEGRFARDLHFTTENTAVFAENQVKVAELHTGTYLLKFVNPENGMMSVGKFVKINN